MPETMSGTMDVRELQRILQIGADKIDVGNGTLFSRTQKQPVATNHLTLVISSGGSGAKAIREAVKTARQKLNANFNTYMKFIMVDSDGNEVEDTTNQIGTGNLKILHTTTPGASDRLLDTNREDFFKKFVHKKFPVATLGPDGSGRNRTAGKVKFYDDAKGGNTNDANFRALISNLYAGDWSDKKKLPVDIMILAGVSGGNGSGTFEELAAHARYACLHAGAEQVRVFGYLFLPDTVEDYERTNPDALSALYINGYAALKELESYESIPAMEGRREIFEARDGVTRITCDSQKMLFDYPVLISGKDEESKQMMAESIINLAMASDETFSQSSFYSNTDTNRSTHLNGGGLMVGGFLKEDIFPEDSHRYCGIGYAYAAIPDEIITANVVSNVCQKLYRVPEQADENGNIYYFCTDEQRMSKFEMEKQIRLLFGIEKGRELNKTSFWVEKLRGALDNCSKLQENQNTITLNDIKAGNTATYEQGFDAISQETEGTERLTRFLTEQMQFFKENSAKVMMAYGPRAMELLFSGKGPNDRDDNPQIYEDIAMEAMLGKAKGELQNIIGKTVNRPDVTTGVLEFLTHRGVSEWKGEFRNAVQHEVKQKIAKKILEPNGAWERIVENPMKEYIRKCSRFADSLEMLTNFYQSAGSSLDARDFNAFQQAAQTGNCVNLCNNDGVYKWVQDSVRKKINSVNVDVVKKAVISSFTQNEESWVSDTEGKTREAFDRVMADSCALGSGATGGTGITLTATSYFDHVLSKEPAENVDNKARELLRNIVGGLLEKSKPSLKKVPGSYHVINRFLLVPQTLHTSPFASNIINALQAEVNQFGGSGAKELSFSAAVTDIVCYQASVANAICDLTDIKNWEDYYNRSTDHVSRHLCNGESVSKFTERTKTEIEKEKANLKGTEAPQLWLKKKEEIIFGTGLSWEHYPPLALRNLAENKYERKFREEIFDPIVSYAMDEKIIERVEIADAGSDVYQYKVNLIPADWNNLNVENYTAVGMDGRRERGSKLFAYLANQNPSSESISEKKIILSGSGKFQDPFSFQEARALGKNTAQIEAKSLEYMKRILRKNTELFLELRETLCRYYEVVKTLEKIEKDDRYNYLAKKFAYYYQYDMIFEKNEEEWRYETDFEENWSLCKFDQIEMLKYSPTEKTLINKGWKILIAFQKFSELKDFDKFEQIANNKLGNTDRTVLNQTMQKKAAELIAIRKQLQNDFFVPAGENRTQEQAIRYVLKLNKDEEEFYVKALLAMWQEFPKEAPKEAKKKDTDSSMGMARGVNLPKETWECPTCGRKNDADFEICPKCWTEPPLQEVLQSWICPKCGRENDADFEICPKCRTERPQQEASQPWTCPKCGYKNEADFEICPKCRTERPLQEVLQSWICPKCGRENDADFEICPKCRTERP